jgi:hypothetical protein
MVADGTTRREALQMAAAAATLGLATRVDAGAANDDALDEALGRLHRAEPKIKQGMSTHAPMVVESLCALGYPDRVASWMDGYRGPVLEIPVPSARIPREGWREALGPRAGASTWEAAMARFGDWREFFRAEMAESPWPAVLDRWAARLAPGLCGAATHGVIRTAHAVRALSRRDTPERRAELARGLAYWASAYQELPARAGQGSATYVQALDRVPLYWEAHRRSPAGNIVEGVRQAGGLAHFAETRDLVATPADVATGLSALSATFAAVYLRHGTQHHPIAFIHAVTGPCALRRLAPHLAPGTARAAFPYAWQAAAAIYAGYARREDAARSPEPRLSRAELAARAAENGDAHVIKFVETLLVEHTLRPEPVYLAAAEDVLIRL